MAERSGGFAVVRIVSWNVRYIGLETRLAEVVSRLVESGAEIVALQEVTTSLIPSTVGLLETHGFVSSVDSFTQTATGRWGRKPFGCVIASRWPATSAVGDWMREPPFPESFCRAIVQSPAGPIDVICTHIPNGAGNGWKKVATYQVLARALSGSAATPQVLAGDFNEPKDMLADGSIVTFSEIEPGEKRSGHRLWTDHDGETGDLHEWEESVQAILGDKPTHRLRDVHRIVHGGMFTPKTHFATGRVPRWFDHILVSPELTPTKCGVYSEWLESGTSDHAGVWVDLD